MNDLGFRNMWISAGVGVTAMVVGSILLRHAEDFRGGFGMLCLLLAIALRHVLDGRELRRRSED